MMESGAMTFRGSRSLSGESIGDVASSYSSAPGCQRHRFVAPYIALSRVFPPWNCAGRVFEHEAASSPRFGRLQINVVPIVNA